MKFDKIKTLKVLEFNILRCLMLMVLSRNLLHIDTPESIIPQFDAHGCGNVRLSFVITSRASSCQSACK